MTRWLIRISLAAVFILGIHGEVEAGIFVGLGVFAYALPAAVDTYVVAAIRANRDVVWALCLLAVTIGGGHYLIGATGGDTKRAVKALGDHGSVQQGVMGAAVGVVIVVVLWRVHVLDVGIRADEAAAAQALLDAELAAREAEIAEQERLARIAREDAEHAARLQAEESERELAARRERDQAERERKEAEARIARENREHAARLAAEQEDRRRQARVEEATERERIARVEAERQERERARLAEERAAAEAKAAAERAEKARAEAAARAEKAAMAKLLASGSASGETRLRAVPAGKSLPHGAKARLAAEFAPKVLAGELTRAEAAAKIGCSEKVMQRAESELRAQREQQSAVNG